MWDRRATIAIAAGGWGEPLGRHAPCCCWAAGVNLPRLAAALQAASCCHGQLLLRLLLLLLHPQQHRLPPAARRRSEAALAAGEADGAEDDDGDKDEDEHHDQLHLHVLPPHAAAQLPPRLVEFVRLRVGGVGKRGQQGLQATRGMSGGETTRAWQGAGLAGR